MTINDANSDWIAAPASGSGAGAIAIIRLDGRDCWQAALKVWRPKHGEACAGRSALEPKPRQLTLGSLQDAQGNLIDHAMAVFFRAPHSYTGNDLVEFHCHGSSFIVREALEALVAAGARMARPGEFTERAFLNGRMDLAQAEAVASLIAAQTGAANRAALNQLEGGLSEEVHHARNLLVEAGAEIEARLDFPEEEIAKEDAQRILNLMRAGGSADREADGELAQREASERGRARGACWKAQRGEIEACSTHWWAWSARW